MASLKKQMLVSRSTMTQGNVAIYSDMMEAAGMSDIVTTERDEEYGSVFVVYAKATVRQLANFASAECRFERENGILSR